MARLVFVLWFPISLAMVLATVAVLAVPEDAFADIPCRDNCEFIYGMGTDGYYLCVGQCCGYDCSGSSDPYCCTSCCKTYSADNSTCGDECKQKSNCPEKYPSNKCNDKCSPVVIMVGGKITDVFCADGPNGKKGSGTNGTVQCPASTEVGTK